MLMDITTHEISSHLSKALARQMSCFSPTEKLSPSASTTIDKDKILPFKWDFSNATHIEASSYLSNGSRLYRMVPLNSAGSCGMTAIADRRSINPNFEMSMPSILMVPLSSSPIRIRVEMREVFPAPVLPTIPIFSSEKTSAILQL